MVDAGQAPLVQKVERNASPAPGHASGHLARLTWNRWAGLGLVLYSVLSRLDDLLHCCGVELVGGAICQDGIVQQTSQSSGRANQRAGGG